MSQDADLRRRLKKLLKTKTLNEIKKQDFSFASLGTLSRIRDGYIIKTKSLRDAFGLNILVSVAACPNCGGGHPIRKCSPKKQRGKPILTDSRENITVIKWYIEFFKSAEEEHCQKL